MLMILLGILPCTSLAENAAPILIAHPDTPVSTLTSREVKAIFTRKKTLWSNGEQISVFVFPSSSGIQQQFCRTRMQMYCYKLDRIWQRLIYSGFGSIPERVADEQEMLHKVASVPGAIGFVSEQNVDSTVNQIEYQ